MTRRALAAALCFSLTLGFFSLPARAITGPNVALCAFVKPTGSQTADEAVSSFESKINRKLDVHRVYEDWKTSFPGPIQTADARAGRTPFIDWEAGTKGSLLWSKIARGLEDRTIKARARALKSFGKRVYLSFHHEPENDGGNPATFVAAWRHIYRIFANVGATNVKWVWTLMASTFATHDATPWYPGARFVDYVGADGYSWYPGRRGSQWRSFQEIFQPAHRWAGKHNTPMMIGETGVQEDPNDAYRKKQWFIDALATLQSWSNVKTFCYFDSNQLYKWWIDSSTASLNGFRTLAQDRYMGG